MILLMKYIVAAILTLAIVALYLNRAYAHIFYFLNENNPGNPTTHMSFIIPPPTPSSAKITYVALGDSLTAGVGAPEETQPYPYQLTKLLTKKYNAEVTLINLGQPGATSADVLRQQVPQVAGFHPDVVTLLIGVNDLHYQMQDKVFKKSFAGIVDGLVSTTKKLNVFTIPYIGNGAAFWPPYQTYFDQQTKRYNDIIREVISGRKVTLIDLYTLTHEQAFNDASYYSPDGFHPSATAYDLWSKIIYDHLDY